MNDQRKVVYEQRKEIMAAKDVAQTISDMRHEVIEAMVTRCVPENALADQWDIDGLHEECLRLFGLDLPVAEWAKEEGIADTEIKERITHGADSKMAQKTANYGADIMRMAEKSLLLQILDQEWKDHLLQLDHLRQGINLRAYAQRDPLNEYKREAFELFGSMLVSLRETVTRVLCHVELRIQRPEEDVGEIVPQRPPPRNLREGREDPAMDGDVATQERPMGVPVGNAARAAAAGAPAPWAKTPRNAPCPCGSGKKYKHCHGKL